MYNFLINFYAFGGNFIKYIDIVEIHMESISIDNETADNVIDLIDTIINTPMTLTSELPKKYLKSIDLVVAEHQSKKFEEMQRKGINLLAMYPAAMDPTTEQESSNCPSSESSDRIKPLGLHTKNITQPYQKPDSVQYTESTECIESSTINSEISSDDQVQETSEQSAFSTFSTTKNEKFIESYGDENMTETIIESKIKLPKENDIIIQTKDNDNASLQKKPIDPDYLADIERITKELSKNIKNDIKENFKQTQQHVKNNDNDIVVDIINYLIMSIDFSNKLIYQIFIFLQKKIMGRGDNLFSIIKIFYDGIINFLVGKISEHTLTKLSRMEEEHGLLSIWTEYKKQTDAVKKHTLLITYLKEYDIDISKEKCDSLTFSDLVNLIKNHKH